MNPVGTEIEATAKWLEERGASGAATQLRRVARQRDQARRELAAERESVAGGNAPSKQPHHTQQESADARCAAPRDPEAARVIAMLRTDLARFQALAERAGWVPDAGPRRLWRWREGWWELGYRRKNSKDGYHDTGWYLWGPDGSFGEWIATHKADAMTDADRLITKHLAATAEVKP
ncbi:hypothetical protein ABZW18_30105 [Streptomyces sp. NPDC004647]|uniref:hypothetical protein n=1 Tax=Streptomyces sp. NPDC004647 TaxID=3154671 RepID=UPI0033B2549E